MSMMTKTLPQYKPDLYTLETWDSGYNILAFSGAQTYYHFYEENNERKAKACSMAFFVGGPRRGVIVALPFKQLLESLQAWTQEWSKIARVPPMPIREFPTYASYGSEENVPAAFNLLTFVGAQPYNHTIAENGKDRRQVEGTLAFFVGGPETGVPVAMSTVAFMQQVASWMHEYLTAGRGGKLIKPDDSIVIPGR